MQRQRAASARLPPDDQNRMRKSNIRFRLTAQRHSSLVCIGHHQSMAEIQITMRQPHGQDHSKVIVSASMIDLISPLDDGPGLRALVPGIVTVSAPAPGASGLNVHDISSADKHSRHRQLMACSERSRPRRERARNDVRSPRPSATGFRLRYFGLSNAVASLRYTSRARAKRIR